MAVQTSWREELDKLVIHITPTCKKQSDECLCSVHFFCLVQSRIPDQWMVPIILLQFFLPCHLFLIIYHRQTEKLYYHPGSKYCHVDEVNLYTKKAFCMLYRNTTGTLTWSQRCIGIIHLMKTRFFKIIHLYFPCTLQKYTQNIIIRVKYTSM